MAKWAEAFCFASIEICSMILSAKDAHITKMAPASRVKDERGIVQRACDVVRKMYDDWLEVELVKRAVLRDSNVGGSEKIFRHAERQR